MVPFCAVIRCKRQASPEPPQKRRRTRRRDKSRSPSRRFSERVRKQRDRKQRDRKQRGRQRRGRQRRERKILNPVFVGLARRERFHRRARAVNGPDHGGLLTSPAAIDNAGSTTPPSGVGASAASRRVRRHGG